MKLDRESYTILVVEDDRILRKLICEALKSKRYQVMEAAHGGEAIGRYYNFLPDMVLLDINLGKGMTGFEVCEVIRKEPYGLLIPIIFLTSRESEEDVVHGFKIGADDYIKKPVQIPQVLAKIDSYFRRFQLRLEMVTELAALKLEAGNVITGTDGEKYKLTSYLSRGGMGVTFYGERVKDSLPVVVKTIKSNFVDDKDIKRFIREAQMVNQACHPNLVKGIDLVHTCDLLVLIMEYVKGESLARILRRETSISPSRALDIVIEISKGVDHLHKLGCMHRDVKPHNIVVTPDQSAVLVDMGLSKAINSSLGITSQGVIIGSPSYMSPEQAKGKAADFRSDIYSLGVTFYQMITGSIPFDKGGSNAFMLMFARCNEDPQPPHFLQPNIPERFSQIILKMMARFSSERYQSVSELLVDLEEATKVLN